MVVVTIGAEPVDAIRAVAVLDDELRRGLYGFARTVRRPVTRDEAAAAVGISRKLAAFHLDKLVDAGLLRCHFGAEGPRKVGRRPKVYEPVSKAIQVAIPARRHDLLAEILVDAVVAEGEQESAQAAAVRVAAERGTLVGRTERDRVRPGRLGAERALTLVDRLLAHYGFEPSRTSSTSLRLRNCPFHPLAERAPELVCALNHAFVRGVLAGLQASSVHACLVPAGGECCVELRQGSLPGADRGSLGDQLGLAHHGE